MHKFIPQVETQVQLIHRLEQICSQAQLSIDCASKIPFVFSLNTSLVSHNKQPWPSNTFHKHSYVNVKTSCSASGMSSDHARRSQNPLDLRKCKEDSARTIKSHSVLKLTCRDLVCDLLSLVSGYITSSV